MNIPGFGKPQNDNPYIIPQPGEDKKKTTFMMFGGLALLLILLFIVLTSGGNTAGQNDLKTVIDETADSLGVLNEYEKKLQSRSTQDEMALVKILLSGNYEKLITLYKDTYSKKTSFTKSPKADAASKQVLDAAVKNDTLDSEIADVLRPKIITARKNLITSKQNFKDNSDIRLITDVQTSYESVSEALNKTQ